MSVERVFAPLCEIASESKIAPHGRPVQSLTLGVDKGPLNDSDTKLRVCGVEVPAGIIQVAQEPLTRLLRLRACQLAALNDGSGILHHLSLVDEAAGALFTGHPAAPFLTWTAFQAAAFFGLSPLLG